MLITRATRRDHDDIRTLLESWGWDEVDLGEGVAFIARQGPVVGVVRLVEVAPQVVVVDDVLVHQEQRGKGVGRQLMQAAMNSRGGTLYLCCHPERIAFYSHLGFAEVPLDECPPEVVTYWEKVGDHPTPPGHVHHFLKAR